MSSSADWKRAVELMRAHPAAMGADPANASRLLLRVGAAQLGYFTQLRRAMGLTFSELHALLSLWDGGRCSMSDLAARVDMSRAAMTTLADRIERMGYIERVADPGDRRRVLVGVTPNFEQELAAHTSDLQARIEQAAAGAKGWPTTAKNVARVREELLDATQELVRTAPTGDRGIDDELEEAADDAATYW